jgi:CRISPR/Cas system CSM-associated protein Csm3 (group 7 of RAMP superfamily)
MRISEKLVLRGILKLESPLLIGCGTAELTDCDVLVDGDGVPYIPATSIAGVLRHALCGGQEKMNDNAKNFWGYAEGDAGCQSALKVEDLYALAPLSIVTRDGIKISLKTGMVENGKKYDYQVVEPGPEFGLELEADADDDHVEYMEIMMLSIKRMLEVEGIHIGAKTNAGFGRMSAHNLSLSRYDFRNDKSAVCKWLARKPMPTASQWEKSLTGRLILPDSKTFSISALFDLDSSLIVRSYTTDPDMPDSVHLQSDGKNVLPGTSLKGAIRARAQRILGTTGHEDPGRVIDRLFGYVKEDGSQKESAAAGRIRVEEIILKGFMAEQQSRIRIDRFTGGVIGSALFDSMPLFAKGPNSPNDCVKIDITIKNPVEQEIGLMLLVLKDLWTGDLAVGGEKAVGRGVLYGKKANITYKSRTIVIEGDFSSMSEEDREYLEGFVNKLADAGERSVANA